MKPSKQIAALQQSKLRLELELDSAQRKLAALQQKELERIKSSHELKMLEAKVYRLGTSSKPVNEARFAGVVRSDCQKNGPSFLGKLQRKASLQRLACAKL